MLPKGWKSGKLADQLDHIIDYRGTSVPKAKSGIPLITARNVRKGFLDLSTTEYIDPNAEKEWMSRGYPHAGDILFTTEAPLGNIAKFPEHGKFCIGQRVVALRTKKHVLTSDFLLYQLLSDKGQDLIDERSSGSTAKGIKTKELKKISIFLPPLPEQKKIAAILSTWDRAIEGTEKLLANSQQQKKVLMQQLLTGKKRLPGFTGEWKTRTLGEIGEISSAGVDKKIVDGELPIRLLNFTDVFKRTFIYSDDLHQWVTAPSVKVQKCNVKKGDVFFTPSSETRDDIAFSAVAAENMQDCCYSYHVVRLRFKEKWDDAFKAFIFSTMGFRRQVYKLADGSGQRYVISQDSFRSIEITYPSLDEQCQIGAILRTAENEIMALKSNLSRLHQEKKALMQQLLTGKRRVKVD